VILTAFLVNTFLPGQGFGQNIGALRLPAPGVMVPLSPVFTPAIIRGMTIDAKNPFAFNFLVDQGDVLIAQDQKKEQYERLIKYFLAALTISEDKQWVNLSPFEKNRIIEPSFGKTEMGRDLLAQDYMLKEITASIVYPESQLGKQFWQKVYKEAAAKYGTTNVAINTFNKVWIVPQTASVYEKDNTVLIVDGKLKVMLEEDYASMVKHSPADLPSANQSAGLNPTDKKINELGSQIIREIVIPALETEVNQGKNFANLRQIYHGMILASWYKQALKKSILTQIYANKDKVKGVDLFDPAKAQQEVYQQYLKAFKKGVYNYIKEEQDPITQEIIPRKYFSGGFSRIDSSHAMVTPVVLVKAWQAAKTWSKQGLLNLKNRLENVKVVVRPFIGPVVKGHSDRAMAMRTGLLESFFIHPLDTGKQGRKFFDEKKARLLLEIAQEIIDYEERNKLGDADLVTFMKDLIRLGIKGITQGKFRHDDRDYIGSNGCASLDGIISFATDILDDAEDDNDMRTLLKMVFIHEANHILDFRNLKERLGPGDLDENSYERSAIIRTAAYFEGFIATDGQKFAAFYKYPNGEMGIFTTRDSYLFRRRKDYQPPPLASYEKPMDYYHGLAKKNPSQNIAMISQEKQLEDRYGEEFTRWVMEADPFGDKDYARELLIGYNDVAPSLLTTINQAINDRQALLAKAQETIYRYMWDKDYLLRESAEILELYSHDKIAADDRVKEFFLQALVFFTNRMPEGFIDEKHFRRLVVEFVCFAGLIGGYTMDSHGKIGIKNFLNSNLDVFFS